MLFRTARLKSFKIPSIEKFRHRKKVSVSVNILVSSHSNTVWRLVLEVSIFNSSSWLNFPQVSSSWLFEFVSKDVCSSLGVRKIGRRSNHSEIRSPMCRHHKQNTLPPDKEKIHIHNISVKNAILFSLIKDILFLNVHFPFYLDLPMTFFLNGWREFRIWYIYHPRKMVWISGKVWEYAVIERWRQTYASLLSTDPAWCAVRCDVLLQLF